MNYTYTWMVVIGILLVFFIFQRYKVKPKKPAKSIEEHEIIVENNEDTEQRRKRLILQLKRLALQIKQDRLEYLRNYIHTNRFTGEFSKEERIIGFHPFFQENLAFAGSIAAVIGGKTIYDLYQMNMNQGELKEILDQLDPTDQERVESVFEIFTKYGQDRLAENLEKYQDQLTEEGIAQIETLEQMERDLVFSEHQRVLNTLKYRNNIEFGAATDTEIWEKISQHTSGTYASHFAGQQAEYLAKDFLESLGYHVELFTSRIHKDDDLHAIHPETGEELDVSVKSYSNVTDFLKAVRDHPDSNSYVINQELYEKLVESGKLKDLNEMGIRIFNGGYKNEELRNEYSLLLENTLDTNEYFSGVKQEKLDEIKSGMVDIEELADLGVSIEDINGFEGIPFVSAIFLVTRSAKNIHAYKIGKKSKHERDLNLGMDTLNIAGRSAGGLTLGMVGGTIGASLGTLLAPGVGTSVGMAAGQTLGSFIGAMSVGKMINERRNQFLYGDIFKAQEAVGSYFKFDLGDVMRDNIRTHLLFEEDTRHRLQQEEKLLYEKYQEQLNPYSHKMPTLNAVLCEQTVQDLREYISRLDEIVEKVEQSIYLICQEMVKEVNEKERNSLYKRFIGEFLLISDDFLFTKHPYILTEEIEKYYKNKEKAPNYPTRLPFQTIDFLQTKALEYFFEYNQKIARELR